MRNALRRVRAIRLLAALLALSLLAAACGSEESPTDAATSEEEADASANTDDTMAGDEDAGHDHAKVIEVPDTMAEPGVALRIEPDPVAGLNLYVQLTDFAITPENASTEPVDGEGHLHLYVDGERQMRFYNTEVHLAGLSEGEHEISVEVSANNHSAYAIDGEAIRATETVMVEPSEHGHSPEAVEVADGTAPTVAMTVFDDPKSGWNLFFDLENFELSAAAAGTDAVDGQGHLHLYVDGEKLTRVYGPWWHLDGLTEGDHEVAIELNGNDHAALAVGGTPIRDTATITVGADQAMAMADDTDGEGHGHDDGEMTMEDDDEMEPMESTDGIMVDGNVAIEVSINNGEVAVDNDRFTVPVGTPVSIMAESDVADEIHLHGYDLLAAVGPGSPAMINFVADVAGVFEVELEGSGTFLFEIAVS